MAWRFVVVDPSTSDELGGLGVATSKEVIWYLDQACTASFTMPGTHPQAALIDEMATDLVAYDDGGTKRFRGRLGSSGDDISSAGHVSTFSAVDYRGFLDRRFIWPGATLSWTAAEQVDIAWQLIADTQATTGGDLGIALGSSPATGVLRTWEYSEGESIMQTITDIGDTLDGFNWEVDSNLDFNTYYPERGNPGGQILAYGGNVVSVQRTLDTTQFANAVMYSGGEGTSLATAVASSFGPTGRWEMQIGDTTILNQTYLNDTATWELDTNLVSAVSYAVVLTPGWWTPDQVWLGDTCTLVIKSGRLNVNTQQRVSQIQLDVGDDGGETVTVTLGPVVVDMDNRVRNALRRLSKLELGL